MENIDFTSKETAITSLVCLIVGTIIRTIEKKRMKRKAQKNEQSQADN